MKYTTDPIRGVTAIETPANPKRCPTKHRNAYKTAFDGLYCPDCGHKVSPTVSEPVKNAQGNQ